MNSLCILSEGRVAYFGPRTEALDYFAKYNFLIQLIDKQIVHNLTFNLKLL
jgi:hypothetical protein